MGGPKRMDLTGQKYGTWTVLEYDKEKSNSITGKYWKCKCGCGLIKSVQRSTLRNGESTRCRKCAIENRRIVKNIKEKELVGKKFNSLTVIKVYPSKFSYSKKALFKCDCGKEKEIVLSSVLREHTKSCGCQFFRNDYRKDYRKVNKDGYVKLLMRDHPNCTKTGYILEHTYVMSLHLGRPIEKGETIHHINGFRDDNRIENLELRTGHHGPGQRVVDMIKFCEEYLAKYKPLYDAGKIT
jgi:hypothetical protein